MTPAQFEKARRLLCTLQDHIRETMVGARARRAATFTRVAAITAADTIYEIDQISEDAIRAWFEEYWPAAWPVQVVMEGVEDDVPLTFPRGTPVKQTLLKCILDPIDGTRALMYDKRSAWILAGLAPQRGARTHLGDLVVAAMTELPTGKQWRADQISAVRGRGLRAESVNVLDGTRTKLAVRPSGAQDFQHGFASLARFFPEGKAVTAQLEETLWQTLYGETSPLIFDDQYICTGGQIYELMIGHDRMLGDLRPLVNARLGITSALVCHPYDICTALLLQEAGGIIERPDGKPLRAPLDTTSPIAWMGYANAHLARQVRPVLQKLLAAW